MRTSKQQLAGGFRLGDWAVNPADGSLTSARDVTRLEPQLMELLVFLCSHAGKVVTKEETLAAVWRGRNVSDDTIKATFYQLRKALGDSPRNPRFIETIPKRGYRVLIDPIPARLEPGSSGRHSDDLYRKGSTFLTSQTGAADLKQARLYLERAIQSDPDHADASSALAHVYIRLVTLGIGSGGDLLPCVHDLAARAIGIAPHSSSAHVALGIATLLHDRNIPAAESSFLSALELDSLNTQAHGWYAKLLYFDERLEASVERARSALSTDVLSLIVRREFVETLFIARRYEDAIREAQSLMQMSVNAPDVQLGMSWMYYLAGDEQKAFNAAYAGFKNLGIAREILQRFAAAFRKGGMDDVLKAWAKRMQQQAVLGSRSLDLLILRSLLADSDSAFELIDEIVKHCHPALLWLPASPIFDKLRADPRFRVVLSELSVRTRS